MEQYVIAGGAIIGILNGASLFRKADKTGFIFFCLAVALGLAFGYLKWFGLPTPEVGLLVALNSSAVYKLVQLV